MTAWVFLSDGQYVVAPFLALYAIGFFAVGTLTVIQSPAMRWGWAGLVRRGSQACAVALVKGAFSKVTPGSPDSTGTDSL